MKRIENALSPREVAICEVKLALTGAYFRATSDLMSATKQLSKAATSSDAPFEEFLKVVQAARALAAETHWVLRKHRETHRC